MNKYILNTPIGNSLASYGNIYGGLTGGGRPYIQVQNQYYEATTITPSTNTWHHFGVQLQTYSSVFYVNFLYDGAVYNLGQFTKNSTSWGSILMIAQHFGGDYPLVGKISNFQLCNSAVYANPWTQIPKAYILNFPLVSSSSTVVLIQGSSPTNIANLQQSISELSYRTSYYMPQLYNNIPLSFPGVINLQSGWLYETVSWSWTDLTLEAWIYLPVQPLQSVAFFDTRPFQNSNPLGNMRLWYMGQAGNMGIYSPSSSEHSFGTATIPINTWTHVAWVLYNGTWSAFLNGVLVGSLSDASLGAESTATNISIGVDNTVWNLTNYKFPGSIFQPMVTAKAKYIANFTPANDLSIGASSDPVLLFVNPGVSGNLQDLVTGTTMSIGGTSVTATGVKYIESQPYVLTSLPGVINLASGWLYETVSWSWTEITVEAWIYSPSRTSQPVSIFDTRPFQHPAPQGYPPLWGMNNDGRLAIYTPTSPMQYFGSATVPINSWTHIAWVLINGNWSAYINGILAGSISTGSVNALTTATNISIGVDTTQWNLTNYKFNGSIFQPMITAKAKYTANFTPANDLSIGSSMDPVLFFANPKNSGIIKDVITGTTLSIGGTSVTATGTRTL